MRLRDLLRPWPFTVLVLTANAIAFTVGIVVLGFKLADQSECVAYQAPSAQAAYPSMIEKKKKWGENLAKHLWERLRHHPGVCGQTKDGGFLAIAHMANTIPSVDWAIKQGANGVEIDLQYDGTTPTKFQHSGDNTAGNLVDGPCDCSCTGDIVLHPSRFMCTIFENDCKANTPGEEMMIYLAKQNLAIVYLDNKLDAYQKDKWNDDDNTQAGKKAADFYTTLFKQGHKGKVLVGVPETKYIKFLESVKSVLDETQYKDRVFYTIDMETAGGGAEKAIESLKTLGTKNLIYSVGITACWGKEFDDHIKAGVDAKDRGDVQDVLIWTIDNRGSIKKYLSKNVTGILTNYPAYAQEEACQANKALAIV